MKNHPKSCQTRMIVSPNLNSKFSTSNSIKNSPAMKKLSLNSAYNTPKAMRLDYSFNSDGINTPKLNSPNTSLPNSPNFNNNFNNLIIKDDDSKTVDSPNFTMNASPNTPSTIESQKSDPKMNKNSLFLVQTLSKTAKQTDTTKPEIIYEEREGRDKEQNCDSKEVSPTKSTSTFKSTSCSPVKRPLPKNLLPIKKSPYLNNHPNDNNFEKEKEFNLNLNLIVEEKENNDYETPQETMPDIQRNIKKQLRNMERFCGSTVKYEGKILKEQLVLPKIVDEKKSFNLDHLHLASDE